jgi:DNA polymerase-3 subunit delta'
VIILLTTDPQRVLETILSRCLRLNFGQSGTPALEASQREWLGTFSEAAAKQQKSLIGRYRLLDVLLQMLGSLRDRIEENLTSRSPMQQYPDAEKNLVERWEDELNAAIEAEYRRQRADLLSALQWWLRDVWLETLQTASKHFPSETSLLSFPEFGGTRQVAHRLSPDQALANLEALEQLQRWLGGNVQEALALEVGLLKLHF